MAKRKRRGRRDSEDAAVSSKPSGGARAAAIGLPLLVGLLGFLAFLPALDAGFVNFDDEQLFVQNHSYRGFGGRQLRWIFTTTFMGHYHPLTWLSSALDYKISGIDPSSYHRNNLILHALNGLLLYFAAVTLLRMAHRLERGASGVSLRIASAVAALLFAVHPMRVESVAWASERRDVLSVFFLLLALLTYLRAVRADEVRLASRRWFVASCGLLVLSLLSKAWGMSFVVVVTILDVYPLRRLPAAVSHWWKRDCRALWLEKIPFLMLGVIAAATAGFAQRSALDTMKTLDEWGLVERVVQAFYGLAFYIGKTLWPGRLVVLYELPYELNPLELRYVFSIFAVAVGSVLVVLFRRRLPSVATAAAMYVVIVAPVLGFAQSGPQFVAEKYSYVCCIGWALLAGGGLLSLWRLVRSGWWRAMSGVAVCVVIAVLFGRTWQQCHVWKDSKTLWDHALASGVPSSTAHLNRGIVFRAEGNVDKAIEYYRRGLEIRLDSGNTWFALGNALKQKRNYAEAEPAFSNAIRHMTLKNKAYLNLGNMYTNNMGRLDDAIAAFQGAIEFLEANRSKVFAPRPYLALGVAYRDKGEFVKARLALQKARDKCKGLALYRDDYARAVQELAALDGLGG